MLEILLALLIMPAPGWRWLLGLTAAPVGVILLFNHVGASPVDPRPQDSRAGGDPSLYVPRSCFPRVLALTCCRDAPPRPWRPSANRREQNGKPMPEGRIVAPKEVRRGKQHDALLLHTSLLSVQDKHGRIKDLFTPPQLRRTTLLLSFIWLGMVFFSSLLSRSHPPGA